MSINKIKNEKFHTVETFPKSNRKMVEVETTYYKLVSMYIICFNHLYSVLQ